MSQDAHPDKEESFQPQSCICSALDMKAFVDCMPGYTLAVRLLSKGGFRGTAQLAELPGVQLAIKKAGSLYSSMGILPAGIRFCFPLGEHKKFCNGHLLDRESQLVSLGNSNVFSIIPAGYEELIVTLDPAFLTRMLGPERMQHFLADAVRIDLALATEPARTALVEELGSLIRRVAASQPGYGQASYGLLSQHVIGLLLDYLHACGKPEYLGQSSRTRLLQRALDVIEEYPDRQFTLKELSSLVFASKRNIQNVFEEIIGLSPMRYIKINRLNLLRQELLDSGHDFRIGELAARYSFTNAGRAVRDYQELFGERPQDTARRYCQLAACHCNN